MDDCDGNDTLALFRTSYKRKNLFQDLHPASMHGHGPCDATGSFMLGPCTCRTTPTCPVHRALTLYDIFCPLRRSVTRLTRSNTPQTLHLTKREWIRNFNFNTSSPSSIACGSPRSYSLSHLTYSTYEETYPSLAVL
jgi:hypothetical protein